jgi:hypothetical protein
MLIWAAHFLAIYAFTAIACERGLASTRVLEIGIVSWAIGVATLAAAVAIVMLIRAAMRGGAHSRDGALAFVHWISAATAGLALVAIVWEALPVLLVPVCT